MKGFKKKAAAGLVGLLFASNIAATNLDKIPPPEEYKQKIDWTYTALAGTLGTGLVLYSTNELKKEHPEVTYCILGALDIFYSFVINNNLKINAEMSW